MRGKTNSVTTSGGGSSENTLKKLLDTTKKAHNLFYFYSGASIDDLISYNDTEFVTDMQGIFYYCVNIRSLPLLNTSNVTNMRDAFYFCSYYLQHIPLYNTSNVTDMRSAFAYCTNLIEIPALNVSNVTNFDGVFYECSSLTRIHMTGMKVSFNISSCKKLNTDALHEIIDNLATVTSTQTLTMGSTNLAKVSEEYKTIATNKGWTLA